MKCEFISDRNPIQYINVLESHFLSLDDDSLNGLKREIK